MLIVKNKRYIKKHVVGGSGIFTDFFKRLVSSNAARTVASNLSKAAASDFGKSAISAAKTVGKELATSAISTAKDLAIEKGKRLIDKASSKVLTPKNVEVIKQLTGLEPNRPVITQKSKDILASLIASPTSNSEVTTNINQLLAGQGLTQKRANAVRIEDLVKRTNSKKCKMGGGLRLA